MPPPLDTNDLLDGFSSLPRSDRQTLLHQLAERLDSAEWTILHHGMNKRRYYKDILGCLPSELAVMVVAYIPPDNLIHHRLVSRRWNSLLIDESVCAVVVKKWFLNDTLIRDSVDSKISERSWKVLLEHALSRERALFTGKFAKILEPDDKMGAWAQGANIQSIVCHYEGRMAWLSVSRDDVISVYDMRMEEFLLMGVALPNREFPSGIDLMRDYAVVTVQNGPCYWYVYRLSEGGRDHRVVRFPNSDYLDVSFDGNTAIIMWLHQIWIYNAVSGKTQEIGISTMGLEDTESVDRVFLDAESRTFLIRGCRRRSGLRMSMSQHTLETGALLKTLTLSRPPLIHFPESTLCYSIEPLCLPQHMRCLLSIIYWTATSSRAWLFTIFWNTLTHQFSHQFLTYAYPTRSYFYIPSCIVIAHDFVLFFKDDTAKPQIARSPLETGAGIPAALPEDACVGITLKELMQWPPRGYDAFRRERSTVMHLDQRLYLIGAATKTGGCELTPTVLVFKGIHDADD